MLKVLIFCETHMLTALPTSESLMYKTISVRCQHLGLKTYFYDLDLIWKS